MAENLDSIVQRCVIKFMQKEGETFTNAYTRLRAVYGEQCTSRTQVFQLFKRFRDGRTSRITIAVAVDQLLLLITKTLEE